MMLSGTPEMLNLYIAGVSDPEQFVQVGNIAFFVATEGENGRELWKTDGTIDGTELVKDIYVGQASSNPSGLVEVDGTLFFTANDGTNGEELWKSDGTAGGTVMVRDIYSGSTTEGSTTTPNSSSPNNLVNVDGTLFFTAADGTTGEELWKSDGTYDGTVRVADINSGGDSSSPDNLVAIGSTLYFTADDGTHGEELWKSDGTSGGTTMVLDINSGSDTSYPQNLIASGNTLFFTAEDGTHGLELWKSDGTETGTELVKDIDPGGDDSMATGSPMLAINGVLYFAANDGTNGNELWKSDGTSDGTVLVKDINPGEEGNVANFAGFTEFNDELFFAASDGTTGKELWKSDGTESGTVLVKDINPGTDTYNDPNNSYPYYMKVVDGTLYFSAFNEDTGRELWQTDGTTAGTVMVDDTVPGEFGLYPNSLETVGGMLVFSGDNGSGREPWYLDPAAASTDDARVVIYVDGTQIDVDANIGVYSNQTTASIYTTDDSGKLIFEPDSDLTIGDFFDIWQTNAGLAGNDANAVFSSTQLFTGVADTSSTVQMFVNGQISTEFDDYVLQDNDEIVLVYTDNTVVSVNTNFGPIVIELYDTETPQTVANFLNYINDGDYLNSIFHRSDPGFVVQGGGFITSDTAFSDTSQFSSVPTDDTIDNEPGISNVRGTIAMARVGGAINSATSQFFVNLSDDNTFLDGVDEGFTVFGRVLDMTTPDEIAELPINTENASPFAELPVSSRSQLVVVESVVGQGNISGVKFLDTDGDGVRDSGESAIGGVKVYIDANDNGQLDDGEVWTTTNANGEYLLQAVPGTHVVRAELNTGYVSSLPSGADSLSATVEVGSEATTLDFGEQQLDAPSGIDLLAAYDTGVASDDDLTNRNNADSESVLQFLVSGVESGAEVKVYSDGVLIGSGTASGTSITIVTDGSTSLADGDHDITATQTLNGGTSEESTALTVTIDATAPGAVTNTTPDEAEINVAYSYDFNSPNEGDDGVVYSLVDAPTGMTIDPDTGVVSWTPGTSQAVPQHFDVVVTDDAGNSSSAAISLTVLGVIPAYADEYDVNEDTTLVVNTADDGVLGNDGDEQSGELSAEVVAYPEHGTLTLNADGTFTYIPEADFYGTDKFTYKASDNVNESNVAEVTITVAPDNDAPVGEADSYSLNEDNTLTVTADNGVLKNDTDVDGDTLTVILENDAAHGELALAANGSFTYTPDAEYSGTDTFTYRINDGTVTSDPITVTLTIVSVNDAPTAEDDTYSVNEDNTLTVVAANGLLDNDTDPDSTSLTASKATDPSHGSVTVNSDGSFTYTPEADYYGSDSFTYTVSDGSKTATGTVNITVNAQADAPTANDDTSTATAGVLKSISVLSNDTSDPDGTQTLSIQSVTQGSNGGTVAINGSSIDYTPAAGFTGTETFTYTIEDTDGLTDTATVTMTVTATATGENALSGFVYIDTNNDGVKDSGEIGVPGVLITLTGTTDSGESITKTAITKTDGSYAFTALPSGTYQIAEKQPEAMSDGEDTTSVTDADAADDQFSGIELTGTTTHENNNFGERGLRAAYVSIRMFLASTPSSEEYLTELMAAAEHSAGNTDLAAAIRSGATSMDNQPTAPVAVDDSYTVSTNGTLTRSSSNGVLYNDTDANGDTLTAVLVADATHGELTLNSDGSFTYKPESDYTGTDTFTYKANDGTYNSNTVTVTITVGGSNTAPTATDDSYTVNAGSTLTKSAATGVLNNDSDSDGDAITAVLVSNVSNGSLTLNANGSFSYTPDSGFHGTDSFTYKANDGEADSEEVTVTITVNGVPSALADSYSTTVDTVLTVTAANGLLDNDTDPDGDSLTVTTTSDPSHGTVTFSANGSFAYTPESGYTGSDSFTYSVSDGNGGTDTATVTISVGTNHVPVASADGYNAFIGTTLNVSAASGVLYNDSDPDGDTITAHRDDDVSHGTLDLKSDGSFTYTPESGYTGTDTFTYHVEDEAGLVSSVVTVTLTVNSGVSAPVAKDDAYTVGEDQILVRTKDNGLLSNDTDADGDTLRVLLASGPSHGVLKFNNNGGFTYEPDPNYHGQDSFTYAVTDGRFTSEDATVTITVGSINDAPVGLDDAYQVDEDQQLIVGAAIGVLANDTDVDTDTLTATVVTDPEHGTLTFNADGSFTYTPNADYYGEDSFTYEVEDTAGGSDQATVTIAVAPVNDAPVAEDDSYRVDVNGELTVVAADALTINDTDIDGDSLTTTVVTEPEYGDVTINSDGTFTYTPDENYHGTDSFQYAASDGEEASTATVTIVVNTLPDAQNDQYGIDEDTQLVVDVVGNGVLGNDNDADGDELTLTLVDEPTHGTLVLEDDGTFTYTPNENYFGDDTFVYQIADDLGGTAEATVTINVSPIDDPPVANDDHYVVAIDSNLTIEDVEFGLLGNDVEVDGQTLTAALENEPSHGTVAVNTNGTFGYTPASDYHGEDSFTYTVTDGTTTLSATVTIGVTTLPVAGADAYAAVEDTVLTVDGSASLPSLLANDTDADQDSLTASLAIDAEHGTVSVNSDGTFTYTPDENFYGQDTFTYTVDDGNGGSVEGTVTITVAGENDLPEATDDQYQVGVDTTLQVAVADGVLANDVDPEAADGSQTLTATIDTDPANGTVTLNSNGSFEYTPASGYQGEDSFTYTVSDGVGTSAAVTVTILVDTLPEAVDDSYTTNEDTQLVVDGSTLVGVLDNDSDTDGDTLTASLVTDASNGSVSLSGDGTFTYTPNENFNGTDTFTYEVQDGEGGSAQATVTITVNSENDLPEATSDEYRVDVNPGSPLSVDAASGVLANDSDVEVAAGEQTLTATLVTGVSDGSLTLNADGSFEYTPPADFQGEVTFTYTAGDGTGSSTETTVTIIVNTLPVATDDAYSIGEGQTLTVDGVDPLFGVLNNDTDADEDSLTAVLVTGTGNGTLNLAADGTFTYTPNADFYGTDTFTYVANDGLSDSAPATVTITVDAAIEAQYQLAFSNQAGEAITSVTEGDQFWLDVYVQDVRSDSPAGVAEAFLDVLYNSTLVTIGEAIEYGSLYTGDQSGDIATTTGVIDEAGATLDASATPGGDEVLLFRVPFTADAAGTALFTPQAADLGTKLVGDELGLVLEKIDFLDASLDIVAASTAQSASAVVDEAFADGEDWLN